MATIVKTRIVKIGNSQGVRIPKLLLDQIDFGSDVELELLDEQIIIRPLRRARAGWESSFASMAEQGDDQLVDTYQPTDWDDADWEW